MEISFIIPHLEAIIFASDKPVTTIDLVELVNNALGFMEDRATLDQIETALDAIREKYDSEFYPFHVIQSGGGWQFLTKPAFHATVSQLNGQKFLKKLSTAALEVLSIIAYKQPITKGEIEEIRGVNSDYAVQKLLEKDLVIISGRKENAPGQPLLYCTSKSFMDYFGINSPADLPQLSDVVAQEMVNPTIVGTANPVETDMPETEPSGNLLVTDTGEIVEAEQQQEGIGLQNLDRLDTKPDETNKDEAYKRNEDEAAGDNPEEQSNAQ
ncbi:MAG: SMC-Scp complex subunit ScpB [Chitinophagaceae bacterium]|jgi:segregation and condensation protein B|nr:SMC-Scp complex subunit ScpB [Chitinophagaceae bacterium]